MRGYISVAGEQRAERIPIDEYVGIYRDPERDQRIVVETHAEEVLLGVADATVSRRGEEGSPVLVEARPDHVAIRNEHHSNPVVVTYHDGDERELSEGRAVQVTRDAVLELGYRTRLSLTVEQEARIEAEGDVEYVAGNKRVRNVDASVDMEDAVVRGDVGADVSRASGTDTDPVSGTGADHSSGVPAAGGDIDASTRIDDAVVDGDVGANVDTTGEDDETQSFCPTHEIWYRGQVCPQCREEQGPTDPERRYCRHCGKEIEDVAVHCPYCGGEQSPK